MSRIQFPQNFIWGTATASYQIEGAFDSDGKGASIWDQFSHTPGKIKDSTNGDTACDHYHRFQEDLDIVEQLGCKAYRFSIAWPRIFPDGRGKANSRGFAFYDRLVDSLLEKNIIPFVTLFHWDLPLALQEKGGWLNRETTDYFAEYTEFMALRLKDRVNNWITINEPYVIVYLGHIAGVHAPGIANFNAGVNANHNLLIANAKSFDVLKNINHAFNVGIAEALFPSYSLDGDEDIVDYANCITYRLFLDPVFTGDYPLRTREMLKREITGYNKDDMDFIQKPMDFIGINNYSRMIIKRSPGSQPDSPDFTVEKVKYQGASFTAMDWEIYPESIYESIKRIHTAYGDVPIFITENGAACDDILLNGKVEDPVRKEYLQSYLTQVSRAIGDGMNVKGYFVWSLLDNFEWAEGLSKRFGLVYVDYPTQKRIIKQSAYWFGEVCKDNGFSNNNY